MAVLATRLRQGDEWTMSFRLIIGAVLAGLLCSCGVEGPPETHFAPPPIDMHADLGKIDGSASLAGPADWTPKPTVVTPVFRAAAPQLLAAMQEILLAQPRTWLMASHPEQQQASFIVRSIAMNFPDTVVVQAIPASDTTSKAVIFSRSRYDAFPFIADNAGRERMLIKALTDRFGAVS